MVLFEAVKGEIKVIKRVFKRYEKIGPYDIINDTRYSILDGFSRFNRGIELSQDAYIQEDRPWRSYSVHPEDFALG